MLLMDGLAHHKLPVKSPARGPHCSRKLDGTPPVFPELLRQHHLLRKSYFTLANAAAFSLLQWHHHNNLGFVGLFGFVFLPAIV